MVPVVSNGIGGFSNGVVMAPVAVEQSTSNISGSVPSDAQAHSGQRRVFLQPDVPIPASSSKSRQVLGSSQPIQAVLRVLCFLRQEEKVRS